MDDEGSVKYLLGGSVYFKLANTLLDRTNREHLGTCTSSGRNLFDSTLKSSTLGLKRLRHRMFTL